MLNTCLLLALAIYDMHLGSKWIRFEIHLQEKSLRLCQLIGNYYGILLCWQDTIFLYAIFILINRRIAQIIGWRMKIMIGGGYNARWCLISCHFLPIHLEICQMCMHPYYIYNQHCIYVEQFFPLWQLYTYKGIFRLITV